MNSEDKQDWLPRRLVSIAVVLFVLNFLLMLFTVTLYENHEDAVWGQTTISVNIAIAVVLLGSLIFSVLERTQLSKTFLVVGIVGLAISSVSIGIKLIDTAWNR